MKKKISDDILSKFSEMISTQMGLYFPQERYHDLMRGVSSAAKEFGFKNVEACIEWLASSPLKKEQIVILASHLTVGETYFFREPKVFEALENYILPEIHLSKNELEGRLRIWSAGCCTGEEPYSIAIMLKRVIPDLEDWQVTILATDINPRFLQKADEGVYREWSFRGTPDWLKQNYFKKLDEGLYEIIPEIKHMVKFSYLNLVEDTFPTLFNDTNAMNMILCRNVLMYFTQKQIRKIIERYYYTLLESGWLVVGPSETSNLFSPHYRTVNFPDAVLYQKNDVISTTHFQESVINIVPESDLFYTSPIKDKISEIPLDDKEKEPETEIDAIIEEEKEKAEEKETERTLFEEAMTCYQLGYYDDTIDKVMDVLTEEKDNVNAMTLLAKAFANQGKLVEAMEWCKRAIEIDKLNPKFYHLYAAILEEQGHFDAATQSLKKALYMDPNFALAYFQLGNLTRQQGKLDESKKYFNNALILLDDYKHDDILPESDGIVAGRLAEIIRLMNKESLA
ncbi:chemotaxis protein CheR [bacterium]|nr:chemotaxis protein CheR [bacterium]